MLEKQEQLNKLISPIIFVLACTTVAITVLSHFQVIDNSAEAIVMPIVSILLLREGLSIYKKYKIWGGVLILVSVVGFLIELIRYI